MLLSANSGMHGPRLSGPRYDMVKDSVDFYANVGFDALDINFAQCIYDGDIHESILDRENTLEKLDMLKEKCASRNIKICATHLPYRYDYNNLSEENYDFNYNMTVKALKASEYIGANWAVMHISNVEGTVEYVKRLFNDSKAEKVGLAIENAPDVSLDVLIKAHDILKAEGYNVGICFDIGHSNVKECYDYDIVQSIEKLGSRIKVLHVHDNCGECDAHKEPYAGNIHWEEVMMALKRIDFKGEFNYELITSEIPDCIREKFAEYYRDIGRYLISVFDNYEG